MKPTSELLEDEKLKVRGYPEMSNNERKYDSFDMRFSCFWTGFFTFVLTICITLFCLAENDNFKEHALQNGCVEYTLDKQTGEVSLQWYKLTH